MDPPGSTRIQSRAHDYSSGLWCARARYRGGARGDTPGGARAQLNARACAGPAARFGGEETLVCCGSSHSQQCRRPPTQRRASGTLRTYCQCCGSGMFIPNPGSLSLSFPYPGSRIPGLGSWIPDAPKVFVVPTILYSHKYHKIVVPLVSLCSTCQREKV
jgi:hypothetical protein